MLPYGAVQLVFACTHAVTTIILITALSVYGAVSIHVAVPYTAQGEVVATGTTRVYPYAMLLGATLWALLWHLVQSTCLRRSEQRVLRWMPLHWLDRSLGAPLFAMATALVCGQWDSSYGALVCGLQGAVVLLQASADYTRDLKPLVAATLLQLLLWGTVARSLLLLTEGPHSAALLLAYGMGQTLVEPALLWAKIGTKMEAARVDVYLSTTAALLSLSSATVVLCDLAGASSIVVVATGCLVLSAGIAGGVALQHKVDPLRYCTPTQQDVECDPDAVEVLVSSLKE